MTLALDPEAVRLAPTVNFADSEGGPLIVMSESSVPSWNGVFDANGNVLFDIAECDYDRACAVLYALIDVGTAKGLTLETPDNTTLVPSPNGARIVRWIGADDEATLITAALALTDAQFTELIGDLVHDGGKLLAFDSAARGATLDRTRTASLDLPAGTYTVHLSVEWRGMVTGADGNPHEVMTRALELRRK